MATGEAVLFLQRPHSRLVSGEASISDQTYIDETADLFDVI